MTNELPSTALHTAASCVALVELRGLGERPGLRHRRRVVVDQALHDRVGGERLEVLLEVGPQQVLREREQVDAGAVEHLEAGQVAHRVAHALKRHRDVEPALCVTAADDRR